MKTSLKQQGFRMGMPIRVPLGKSWTIQRYNTDDELWDRVLKLADGQRVPFTVPVTKFDGHSELLATLRSDGPRSSPGGVGEHAEVPAGELELRAEGDSIVLAVTPSRN